MKIYQNGNGKTTANFITCRKYILYNENTRWRNYLCLYRGRCLRFIAFRRLFVTVFACFRQACKRCPFMARKDTFQKAKSHILEAERTPFETVTVAVQLKIDTYI